MSAHDEILAGYTSSESLAVAELALSRLDEATAVLLVEGVSDRIAVEALAVALGRDLDPIAVLPTGGVHAFGRFIEQLGPHGDAYLLAGLYDADEAAYVREALVAGEVMAPDDDPAEVGFFHCERDLEEELIRALGIEACLDVIEREGDLRRFRTMQRQPEWRDRPVADQIRRFLGSGAQRKMRYAAAFTSAVPLDRVPAPLVGALDAVTKR